MLVLLCTDNPRPGGMGFLIGAEAGISFYIRPFTFKNRILPVSFGEGNKPNWLSLIHPGSSQMSPTIAAEAPIKNSHFGKVAADRGWVGDWESFDLVPVPWYLANDYVCSQAKQIDALDKTSSGILDLYTHFSDDAFAARPSESATKHISAFISRFESLGVNCEFCFVQRQCGAEPLGLLRFAGGLGTQRLADAIRNRFAGFGELEQLRAEYHPNDDLELLVYDQRSGFNYHTWRKERTDTAKVCREEAVKLQFLKTKLLEDFEDAEKIFVIALNGGAPEESVDDLYDAMRELGPVTLLTIVGSDPDHPSGTVVRVRGGLLRGYIDSFAKSPWMPDLHAWLRLCRNALALQDAPPRALTRPVVAAE